MQDSIRGTARRSRTPRRVDGRAGTRAGRADRRRRASRPGTRTRCSGSTRGERALRVAPAAAHAAVADRARHGARVPRAAARSARRLDARAGAGARADRVLHRRRRDRRALLSDGARRRRRRARVDAGRVRRRRRARRARARTRSSTRSPGIHAFDWQAGGLDGFGRPDGYLERQVPRWLGQLERYKTRPLPEVDAAGQWLAAHTPPTQPPGVIHGDYKLDNVMFAPQLPGRARRGRRLGAVDDRRSARRPRLGARAVDRAGRARRRSPARRRSRRRADVPTRRELLDALRRQTPTATSSNVDVLLRARPVQARVRDGRFVRALPRRHERRRVLRVAGARRSRARAPRARVRRTASLL